MDKVIKFDRERFDSIINTLSTGQEINKDLIYEIYETTCDGIEQLIEAKIIIDPSVINPFELIYYSVGEYIYTTTGRSFEEQQKLIKDENYITSIASVVSDKYISLSMFNHAERKLANKYE